MQFTSGNDTVPLRLLDASRVDILGLLERVGRGLAVDDTLLVYFAGHGQRDDRTGQSYWIPIDGTDARHSWIPSTELADQIKLTRARHVLVIADSCYSGNLMRLKIPNTTTKGGARRIELAQLDKRRSRAIFTSGDDRPVDDGNGDGMSIFARALHTALLHATTPLTTAELAIDVRKAVTGRSEQIPAFRSVGLGDDGGDVVFVPRP